MVKETAPICSDKERHVPYSELYLLLQGERYAITASVTCCYKEDYNLHLQTEERYVPLQSAP